MRPLTVGIVADPAKPADVARRFRDRREGDLGAPGDVSVVEESFTLACEDVETALSRLAERAREHRWERVIGVTELPLHDGDGRYLLVETDEEGRSAVVSLPALAGMGAHRRSARVLADLVASMADDAGEDLATVTGRRHSGRSRVLLGMVLANRPWRLVPGLKSALVAALTTGAIATINSTVWLLADSLAWWRLAVASVTSVALVVGWLIVDGELWDRPQDASPEARDRSRLYNASTVLTLAVGGTACYLALYVLNLCWALFVLDPSVMGGYLQRSMGYSDLLVLSWFVASAATVGGALGSGLESDEAIRAATYAKREEERRSDIASRRRS